MSYLYRNVENSRIESVHKLLCLFYLLHKCKKWIQQCGMLAWLTGLLPTQVNPAQREPKVNILHQQLCPDLYLQWGNTGATLAKFVFDNFRSRLISQFFLTSFLVKVIYFLKSRNRDFHGYHDKMHVLCESEQLDGALTIIQGSEVQQMVQFVVSSGVEILIQHWGSPVLDIFNYTDWCFKERPRYQLLQVHWSTLKLDANGDFHESTVAAIVIDS